MGGSGEDILRGQNGRDTLDGGTGADTLTGGAKIDTFVFDEGDSILGSRDTITDMVFGETIELAAHTFIGTSSFSGSGDFEVRYISGATTSSIVLDYDGDGAADEAINVTGEFAFISDGDTLTAVAASSGSSDDDMFG